MRRQCQLPLGVCGDGPRAGRSRLPETHGQRQGRSVRHGHVLASCVFLRLKPGVVRNRGGCGRAQEHRAVGPFPAGAACSRYREQDALHPNTSTIRGAGASTCRNRFANDPPLRSTPLQRLHHDHGPGRRIFYASHTSEATPRAPADLTKGTEAPSPEARGEGPSAVGRPPRTDCLPVLRALDRALPQRRPNALITVW